MKDVIGLPPREPESSVLETNSDNDSDDQLRVCILCEPSPITYTSGHANRFRALLQYLTAEEEGHDVHLVTAETVHPDPPTDYSFSGSKHHRFPIHYTNGFVFPQYPTMTLSCDTTLKTLRVLRPRKNHKFHLIHASSPGFFLFWAVLASRIYRIPLMMSYHTHLPVYVRSYLPAPWNRLMEWFLWKALRVLHSFADLTLLTSPQMADEFAAHRIPRCDVWQKGIDTTRFHPDFKSAEMRSRMTSGHPDRLLLAYIGRLAKEKRLQDLRDILEQLNRQRNIPTHLCLIGGGPQEAQLQDYFKGTPTTFLGHFEGLELSQAFASGDVFCMPSDSETLGFVVLESLASGVPCVAARAGGLVDLIEHDTTGYLVQTGDIGAFCHCIQLLQSDPGRYNRISMSGRQETERWSWQSSMERLRKDSYEQTVKNYSLRFEQRILRWFRSFAGYGSTDENYKRNAKCN